MFKGGFNMDSVSRTSSEMEKNKKKGRLGRVLKDFTKEFFDVTSIGGLGNSFHSRPIVLKCLWVAVLIVGTYFTCNDVYTLYQTYYSYPYTTQVNVVNEVSLEVPGMTVCNQNRISCAKILSVSLDNYKVSDTNFNKFFGIYLLTLCGLEGIGCKRATMIYYDHRSKGIPRFALDNDQCLYCNNIFKSYQLACNDLQISGSKQTDSDFMAYLRNIWLMQDCLQQYPETAAMNNTYCPNVNKGNPSYNPAAMRNEQAVQTIRKKRSLGGLLNGLLGGSGSGNGVTSSSAGPITTTPAITSAAATLTTTFVAATTTTTPPITTVNSLLGAVVNVVATTQGSLVSGIINTVSNATGSIINETVSAISNATGSIVNETVSAISNATGSIVNETVSAVSNATVSIVNGTVSDVANATGSIVDATVSAVSNATGSIVNETVSAVSNATVSIVNETVSDVANATGSIVNATVSAVSNATVSIVNGTVSAVSNATGSIVNETVSAVSNATGSIVNGTISAVTNATGGIVNETINTVNDVTNTTLSTVVNTSGGLMGAVSFIGGAIVIPPLIVLPTLLPELSIWTDPLSTVTTTYNGRAPSKNYNLQVKYLLEYLNLTEGERIMLGYTIDEFIVDCSFMGLKCDTKNDFVQSFSPTYGNCYTFSRGNETSLTGDIYGLAMVLNIHQDTYLPQLLTAKAGVRLAVHDLQTVPPVEDNAIDLPADSYSNVGVRKHFYQRLPAPFDTSCYNFWNDTEYSPRTSDASNIYATSECLRMCLQQKFIQGCVCRHPLYPEEFYYQTTHYVDFPVCNLTVGSHDYDCIGSTLTEFANDTSGSECNCNVQCQENQYVLAVSQATWAPVVSKERVAKKYNSTTTSGDLLAVNIYFSSLIVEQINLNPVYQTPTDILAALGGSLGLYLGFCLVAVGEVIEFILMVTWYVFLWSIGKLKEPEEGPSNGGNEKKEMNDIFIDRVTGNFGSMMPSNKVDGTRKIFGIEDTH